MNRKLISFLLIFAGNAGLVLAQTETKSVVKLSPITKLYLEDQKKNTISPKDYVYKKDASGTLYLSAMVKVNSAIKITDLQLLGVKVGTKAGLIWTLSIPVHQFENFTLIKGLEYIQLDEPLQSNMDNARIVTRVDSVHNGSAPLPSMYTGKGVVIGVIDAGFDYNHPTFRDTSGFKWRIKKVWEQKVIGTAPAGFSFGNEITDTLAIQTKGTDLAQFSHGTHVAGIAAGSGVGSISNQQFRGVSFSSDLVFVGITPDSTQWISTGMSDIIDGMNYIYTYAASVGKPAVANLSWGCTIGAHDGTSLFSEACDALTGKGKIFVCSGGNNGSNNIHLGKKFTPSDTLVHTELGFSPLSNTTWVDIWGDSSKKFCLKVNLYNITTSVSTSGWICLDNIVHNYALVGSDGDTCFVDIIPDSSTFNHKPRMFLRVLQKSKNTLSISLKATEGSINMWTGYVQQTRGIYGSFNAGTVPNTTFGNTDMTTGDIASTKSAIAVASFASKLVFTNLAGGTINYGSYAILGKLAPYSSKGPTVDNRTKPDIAGPGLMIGSGVSSFDNAYTPSGASADHTVAVYKSPFDAKNYYYGMLTGTSMSSPVVAGIVGLMLEANPNLDPPKVLQILKETAIHDFYTGPATATGSNFWGHGKVNAFAAVNRAIEALGISSAAGINAIDCRLYPNPTNGLFHLDFMSQQNETLTIEILDLSGKRQIVRQWEVRQGLNTTELDARILNPGLYFTRLSAASRGNISFKVLVY
jgi:minor extracellular serine protease Vpr